MLKPEVMRHFDARQCMLCRAGKSAFEAGLTRETRVVSQYQQLATVVTGHAPRFIDVEMAETKNEISRQCSRRSFPDYRV